MIKVGKIMQCDICGKKEFHGTEMIHEGCATYERYEEKGWTSRNGCKVHDRCPECTAKLCRELASKHHVSEELVLCALTNWQTVYKCNNYPYKCPNSDKCAEMMYGGNYGNACINRV